MECVSSVPLLRFYSDSRESTPNVMGIQLRNLGRILRSSLARPGSKVVLNDEVGSAGGRKGARPRHW